MGKWKLIEKETEFRNAFVLLKKSNKGHYYTNFNPLTSRIDSEIEHTEFLMGKYDDNLFLIERYDDFYKLIYVLFEEGVLSNFSLPQSVDSGVLVTDIIEIEGHEKQREAISHLLEIGFVEYKRYHLWECSSYCMIQGDNTEICGITTNDKLWISDIYKYFDKYSDCLPMRRMFQSFSNETECLSFSQNGDYIGGVLYHTQGRTATEDFIFITNEFRGVGKKAQSVYLEDILLKKGIEKVYAWIDDDNKASIMIHEQNGFVKTNRYKITLLKDGELMNAPNGRVDYGKLQI